MKTSTILAHLLVVMLAAVVLPSHAHGVAARGAESARWTFDPWILIPLALAMLLYGIGLARLQARRAGSGTNRAWQIAAYVAGWIALFGALLSPLHWLGEHLFTFHMIEHEIVMAVAAPLLVLARPAGVLLWAFPHHSRLAIGAAWRMRGVRDVWDWITRAGNATLLHGLAIWLWHVPPLFDAAVASPTLHRLQHLSFLVTALIFWWSMLRRSNPGKAVWHLFLTMTHTSVLGALMALAPRVLYQLQTAGAPAFGLTPLEDQQLAGILMWIPAETVYAGAVLVLAARWIRGSASPTRTETHDGALDATPV